MIDIENGFAVSRMTNLQLFAAVPDPADQTKLWGARWWDTTGAAPTFTKGQLVGLEGLWLPTSANKSDADGTAVLATMQAQFTDGKLSELTTLADVKISANLRGSGSPTVAVSADTKLYAADASYTALGTIAATSGDTSFMSLEAGALLDEGPAVEIKIAQSAAADTFEVFQIETHTNRRPRIA